MNRLAFLLSFFITIQAAKAQIELDYYLPAGVSYQQSIPTPKEIIGHEVGEWHVTHDKLVYYMRAIAEASPRATLIPNGATHEGRPQLLLAITSEENQKNLEELRLQHKKLTDPNQSDDLDISKMPIVLWQGFSIHGNEPSGSNSSLLAAYHYTAATGSEIDELLDNVIILLDPSYNPDGLTRFSTWANSNRSKNLVTDPNNREQNEMWPRGRTNHYQFDLNRDWLPVQQPESRNRIHQFHRWKPNILTDHHEMGTNATFFFQPGIPSRNNPNTPSSTIRLTEKIGEYHAKALDDIGSLYYSGESYDDFYYGKGSTFPDINGAVGILFEQASSRGHAQESIHGILKFPFTIRNQFTTVLSTSKAAFEMRLEMLEHQRNFFKEAIVDAKQSSKKGIVFGSKGDANRSRELANILVRHEITVHQLDKSTTFKGQRYQKETGFFVPLEQSQARLINIIFEKVTSFQDSLFYDVSAWTLPLAFGLEYDDVDQKELSKFVLGDQHSLATGASPTLQKANYAYLFKWNDYYAPKVLWELLDKDILVKVATTPIEVNGEVFPEGSVIIPAQNQKINAESLFTELSKVSESTIIPLTSVNSGNTQGVNLGSPMIKSITKPSIAMIAEGGVSSYDAGEVWHLLDNRFNIPVSIIPFRVFNKIDLGKYNTIILVNGSYGDMKKSKIEELKSWTQKGGTIIAMKAANNWLNAVGITSLQFNKPEGDSLGRKDYKDLFKYRGAQVTGGSIFMADLDISNPLGYGYSNRQLPVFINNNSYLEVPKNPYASPLKLTSNPLLSGYISEENYERIKGSSAIVVSSSGRGKVISFSFNPNFRAFWYGTNKLFLNAIFYSSLIDQRATNK